MSQSPGVVITQPPNYSDEITGYSVGWIILAIFLTLFVTIFASLWIIALNQPPTQQSPPIGCFGPFGVQAGIDANPLNQCGAGFSNPCIFAINSLIDAETQCNTLQSICNAFTFNFSTATMKIVNPSTTFTSTNANLFIRQPSST